MCLWHLSLLVGKQTRESSNRPWDLDPGSLVGSGTQELLAAHLLP